jgi:hypothetical protein
VRRRTALLALAALGLIACQPARAAPPTPTRTAQRRPLVHRPTPRPIPTPYPSGGLGLFRDEWELRHGRARGAGPFFGYANGRLGVAFVNDLVWYLERSWGAAEVVPVEAARAESRAYIPSDARFRRTYETRGLRRVDLYASPSLVERFRLAAKNGDPVDPWLDAEPGTFIVYYHEQGERVASFVLSTGNNP